MDLKHKLQQAQERLGKLYQRANKLSGGTLEIIRVTVERFVEERGSETAASLGYYAFFSIFPMLLAIIVIGSFFLDISVVETQLLNVLSGTLPGAESLVIQNINHVLELRGTITFIALISLIWSATSVFNILAININRAFPRAGQLDFVKSRLRALLIFLGLGLLLVLSLATSTLVGLIPVIELPIDDILLHETIFWRIGAIILPVLFNWLMFWGLYQWVPTISVSRRASTIGGLVVGVAWQILNRGFAWFLSSSLNQYQLVYGSLGTVVALLFWVYLTATIVLIGAHLTAAIQKASRARSDD